MKLAPKYFPLFFMLSFASIWMLLFNMINVNLIRLTLFLYYEGFGWIFGFANTVEIITDASSSFFASVIAAFILNQLTGFVLNIKIVFLSILTTYMVVLLSGSDIYDVSTGSMIHSLIGFSLFVVLLSIVKVNDRKNQKSIK